MDLGPIPPALTLIINSIYTLFFNLKSMPTSLCGAIIINVLFNNYNTIKNKAINKQMNNE